MKFHDILAILSVVVVSALSVLAQSPEVVLNGLYDVTNITYTAMITTQAVTEQNAFAQVFRVGGEFANIMDRTSVHGRELDEGSREPFPDNVALGIISALEAYVDSYIGFLDALIGKHDIIVSEHSPFNPDARPIALILPDLGFFSIAYEYLVIQLLPTRKEEACAVTHKLHQAFQDTIKVYPTPKQANEVPLRISF